MTLREVVSSSCAREARRELGFKCPAFEHSHNWKSINIFQRIFPETFVFGDREAPAGLRFHSVVVITFASHMKGPWFETGQKQLSWRPGFRSETSVYIKNHLVYLLKFHILGTYSRPTESDLLEDGTWKS